jgi:hypothetical protein
LPHDYVNNISQQGIGAKYVMKTLYQSLLLAIGALALAGTAHAQLPAGNDTSDGFGNTGMGTQALVSMASPDCTVNPFRACFNTASGNQSLLSNTTGSSNTALGYQGLRENTTGTDNTALGLDVLYWNNGSFNTGSGSQALTSNTTGTYNTASGYDALWSNTNGAQNTALGSYALELNNSGGQNVAVGYQALAKSTVSANTAVGWQALSSDTTGANNAAFGSSALAFNQVGTSNVAVGYGALYRNTASNNTAIGWQSLNANSSGAANTASGAAALFANTTGSNNTGSGYYALQANTTGIDNTASGYEALYTNKVGTENTAFGVNALYGNLASYNTAVGYDSLHKNTSGKYNVAMGWEAGFALTTGSHNIDIANPGESTDGIAADSGVIRIGTQMPTALQTLTYIAGIYDNTSVSGLAVVIDSNGQLGTVSSSERFKTAIAPMGSNTAKLQQLRPVTFRYKADPQGTMRYGLIAEDVAKVYPELVIRDGSGRIDGVRYDELAPMLLNEAQRQQRINEAQAAETRDLKQQVAELKALNQATQVALRKIQAKDEFVAQR